MSYIEAAWDGSVERVSDALRAGVHADTTMPVSDLGTLDSSFNTYVNHTGTAFHAATIHNTHNFNTISYIMRDTCVIDISSCMLRPFMYKTPNGEEHSNQ